MTSSEISALELSGIMSYLRGFRLPTQALLNEPDTEAGERLRGRSCFFSIETVRWNTLVEVPKS